MSDKYLQTLDTSGDVASTWKFWKQKFTNYLIASEINKKSDEIQIAQLLHHIGDNGLRIFNTFKFSSNEESEKYENIIKAFDAHFAPKKNVELERYKFFTRKQNQEKFEHFVTELKNIALNCEFKELQDDLVKSMIICGVESSHLRQQLLEVDNRTLDEVIKMCMAVEESQHQVQQMASTSTSSEVYATFNNKYSKNSENIYPSNNTVTTFSSILVPQNCDTIEYPHWQDQSSDVVNTKCTKNEEKKSTLLTNENTLSSLKTEPLSPSSPSGDLFVNSEDDDSSGDECLGALSTFLETEVTEHNMKFLQMLQAGIERYYKSQQKFNVQSCSTLMLNECYTEPGDHKKEIVANSKIYFPITIIKQIERKAEKEPGICDWKYVVKFFLNEVYGDNISKYTAVGSQSKFKECSRPGIDSQLYKAILAFVRSKSNKQITEKMYNQYINKLSYNKRTAVKDSQLIEITDDNLLFFRKIIRTVEKSYEIQQKATLLQQDRKLPDWCTMPARKKTKISESYNVYLPSSSVSYIKKKSETCNGTRDWKILVKGAILEIYGNKIRDFSAKGTRGERPAIDTELYRAIYDWVCKTTQEEIDEKKFIEVINTLASNKRKSSKKKSV